MEGGLYASVAGAQEKTALLFLKGRWYKPLATTATTHILKPQIGQLPNGIDLSYSVENEFFCLKLTAALGLPSAAIAIDEFEGNPRSWSSGSIAAGAATTVSYGCPKRIAARLCPCRHQKYEFEGGPGIPAILSIC